MASGGELLAGGGDVKKATAADHSYRAVATGHGQASRSTAPLRGLGPEDGKYAGSLVALEAAASRPPRPTAGGGAWLGLAARWRALARGDLQRAWPLLLALQVGLLLLATGAGAAFAWRAAAGAPTAAPPRRREGREALTAAGVDVVAPGFAPRFSHLVRANEELSKANSELQLENRRLLAECDGGAAFRRRGHGQGQGRAPVRAPARASAHGREEERWPPHKAPLPAMYGKVKEKTIWSYWYHPEQCRSSRACELPPHIQLCCETARLNSGSFAHKLVHMDEVELYVDRRELPARFTDLTPPQQKDALMNALLARYGGVALDISTVLLRPFDDYWGEMVAKGATFRGYMYRLNGLPWRHAEVTAVWFLMARREGVFATAARTQVLEMGDSNTTTDVYPQAYFALGDQTLLPILTMFNYSFPRCINDGTVMEPHQECPEHEQRPWYEGLSGPPRTDSRLLLRDPRDGPQLPFAFLDMELLDVADESPLPRGNTFYPPGHDPGGPMYREACATKRQCWEEVFLRRFREEPRQGEARRLSFVKLFNHAKVLHGVSRAEILANRSTYFHHWLRLAGLPEFS